jgi:hypothetical protein
MQLHAAEAELACIADFLGVYLEHRIYSGRQDPPPESRYFLDDRLQRCNRLSNLTCAGECTDFRIQFYRIKLSIKFLNEEYPA